MKTFRGKLARFDVSYRNECLQSVKSMKQTNPFQGKFCRFYRSIDAEYATRRQRWN